MTCRGFRRIRCRGFRRIECRSSCHFGAEVSGELGAEDHAILHLASYLLQGKAKESEASSFREESRKAIAELTPSGAFSGEVRSVLLIKYLSEPRTIAPGKYQVDMIATRTIISQQGEAEISFNRTFTLETVDIPKSPLGKNALEIEKAVYSLREAGLEISKLEPFNPSSQP